MTGDGCIVDSCIVDGCVVAEDGSRRSSTASEPQCALIEILLVEDIGKATAGMVLAISVENEEDKEEEAVRAGIV